MFDINELFDNLHKEINNSKKELEESEIPNFSEESDIPDDTNLADLLNLKTPKPSKWDLELEETSPQLLERLVQAAFDELPETDLTDIFKKYPISYFIERFEQAKGDT
jgi:hypothetical protein